MKRTESKRTQGAELALIATVVEVAILGVIVPEFKPYAIVLIVPFMLYGLYFVTTINKCK